MKRPLLGLLTLSLGACAPLPPLVTEAQVRAAFPGAERDAGRRCASRLNAHVRASRAAGLARPIVLGAGAVLAGTGVALRDAEPEASLPLAATGAVVGLVAELVVRVVADPADLLGRHARGLASWDAARHGGTVEDLERCERDEAPPRYAMPVGAEGDAAP